MAWPVKLFIMAIIFVVAIPVALADERERFINLSPGGWILVEGDDDNTEEREEETIEDIRK